MGWISESMSITPTDIIFYAVIVGAIQNVLSKAIKHSLFDSTKEMAYIPLDEELKTKGKAAADVIGGRLGKSGGAIIQQIMLSFVYGSTLLDLATPLFVFFVMIMIVWLYATIGLGRAFKAKTS
jgi:AAA family ATP:ADP antiporter